MLVSPTPNRMSGIVAGAVVCALFSLVVQATAQQTAPQPALPDVQKLGPQVGSRVPDFTLLDQKGQSRTLSSLMGPKGLMLVFYRSADWCPYCKTQLAELQTRTADLAKSGIGLAAVSYDAVPILADFTKRRGIMFRCCRIPDRPPSSGTGFSTRQCRKRINRATAFHFPARSC